MFIHHQRFQFGLVGVVGKFDWSRTVVGHENRTVFGEVQFAAVRLTADGPNRGRFPSFEYVERFRQAAALLWNGKTVAALGFTPESPFTLEKLAEYIHADAVVYVATRPLVAVHAVRLSWLDDFSDAVTYVATTVPIEIVNGLVTYSRKKGG